MPPMPENSWSGNALVSCDIFASDCGRIAGPPRPPLDTRPSTFISKSSVSGSISGSDGKVFDDTIASAPPLNAAPRLFDDLGRRRRQLRPHRHLRDFLHDLGDDRDLLLILAEVRAHVLAIHVRARQVQLERIGAGVLAGLGEVLPVRQLLVAARAGHDRRDQHAIRIRLLDALDLRDPPVERLVGDQLPVPRRVQRRLGPLLHRQLAVERRAQELGFRPGDVGHRVQADRLGDDAAPARPRTPA